MASQGRLLVRLLQRRGVRAIARDAEDRAVRIHAYAIDGGRASQAHTDVASPRARSLRLLVQAPAQRSRIYGNLVLKRTK